MAGNVYIVHTSHIRSPRCPNRRQARGLLCNYGLPGLGRIPLPRGRVCGAPQVPHDPQLPSTRQHFLPHITIHGRPLSLLAGGAHCVRSCGQSVREAWPFAATPVPGLVASELVLPERNPPGFLQCVIGQWLSTSSGWRPSASDRTAAEERRCCINRGYAVAEAPCRKGTRARQSGPAAVVLALSRSYRHVPVDCRKDESLLRDLGGAPRR